MPSLGMAHPQRSNVAIHVDSARNLGEADPRTGAGRIARIEVFDDLPLVEATWRRLERDDAVKTPYQSFDLLSSWQRHVGAPASVKPHIVVGFDVAGKPVFLWPLGHTQRGPLQILSFLGGKHANFNFALWRRDSVQNVTAEDIRVVLAQVAARHPVDILMLLRQPQSWQGFVNPFALLPHQSSPNESMRLAIIARGEEQIKQTLSSTMRGQLRSKGRRLQKLADYRYVRATTPGEVERLLNAFFPLKAAHMKAQALPNIFGDPCHEAFLRDACHQGLATGNPLIEIHAIEGGGEMLAVFGAINDGRRTSGMFNTYTVSDNARQSPGLVLLVNVIGDLADRGVQAFDLGVGEAKYKTFFCKEPEPLFDSFLPLTPLGRVAAVTARASGHLKRRIKQSGALLRLVHAIRGSFSAGGR
jgi:CelD/BcsL family acetyltransferase involved in cellulose biosynthesis